MTEPYLLKTNVNRNLKFLGIDDIGLRNLEGKTILYIADINSSVKEGRLVGILNDGVIEYPRIDPIIKDLKELSGAGAKIFGVSHQGRANKPDCISLADHIKVIEERINKEIIFQPGVFYGEEAARIIRNMKNGELFFLENIRLNPREENYKVLTPLQINEDHSIKQVEDLVDLVINDAPSAWRMASPLGFINRYHIAGRLMVKELGQYFDALKNFKEPFVAILGGAKINDYIKFMVKVLESEMNVMIQTTGLLGILFHYAEGLNFGRDTTNLLQKNKLLDIIPNLREIYQKHGSRIDVPYMFCVADKSDPNPQKTRYYFMEARSIDDSRRKDNFDVIDISGDMVIVNQYGGKIINAASILNKGPAGRYDIGHMGQGGSLQLFRIMIRATEKFGVYTAICGADTVSTAKALGQDPSRFSMSSISGGGALDFFTGIRIQDAIFLLNHSWACMNGKNPTDNIPEGYNQSYILHPLKTPVQSQK